MRTAPSRPPPRGGAGKIREFAEFPQPSPQGGQDQGMVLMGLRAAGGKQPAARSSKPAGAPWADSRRPRPSPPPRPAPTPTLCSTSVFPRETGALHVWRPLQTPLRSRRGQCAPAQTPNPRKTVRAKAREPPPEGGRCCVTLGEFLDPAVLVTADTRANGAEARALGTGSRGARSRLGHWPPAAPPLPGQWRGRETRSERSDRGQQGRRRGEAGGAGDRGGGTGGPRRSTRLG